MLLLLLLLGVQRRDLQLLLRLLRWRGQAERVEGRLLLLLLLWRRRRLRHRRLLRREVLLLVAVLGRGQLLLVGKKGRRLLLLSRRRRLLLLRAGLLLGVRLRVGLRRWLGLPHLRLGVGPHGPGGGGLSV